MQKPVQRGDGAADKRGGGGDGSDSDSDDYAYDTARQLKQYQVNTVPPLDHWVDLGDLAEGVEFMRWGYACDKALGALVQTLRASAANRRGAVASVVARLAKGPHMWITHRLV